ncbi:M50 family metallopeptidase [Bacillus sp. FJAT-45037]|uniref:M50 family metallopeptidase n=1 Tax=Bacillus sp. FJAT-45037 TaxID=2011007 RepID=UPI001E3894D3|nr:M50 family metallopeptidase [Bacillus sp. FJAT-45037]
MKINPFFWFVIGIGVVTGYFREVLLVFMVVLIHELGHAWAAHYFKWTIHKIELLPFGGVAEVEDSGNRPIKEELIVVLAGPFQHVWMLALSFLFVQTSFWSEANHELFVYHNMTILLINLVPILPLDGGRLMQLAFMWKYSFHQALRKSLVTSFGLLLFIMIMSVVLLPVHLNLWVVLTFLLIVHYLEWKQRHFRMMRFLIGRQLAFSNEWNSDRRKSVAVAANTLLRDGTKQLYRGCHHQFHFKDPATQRRMTIDEKEVIDALVEKKSWQLTFCELPMTK